jgi:hypothetical protein
MIRRWRYVLAVFAIAFGSACGEHPTDDQLIARFKRERASFERLRDMFVADRTLGRVAPDFTRPVNFFSGGPLPSDPPVTSQRLAEYHGLFEHLGLESGVEGYDDKEEIFFHASSMGLAVSGSSKGYAYLASRPALMTNSLDDYWSPDGTSFTAFRPIEGRWYLYFDYED